MAIPEPQKSPLRQWGSRSHLDPLPGDGASAEQQRLQAADAGEEDWKKWGPYVSERQWGTCREDYGTNGNSWEYLPFHIAHQVAYRWSEDGIAGVCDEAQTLCLSLAMWNGKDPILKERLFGLGGPQGNHGEDVKDMYYYLDATPTHSYLKMLYKYPQKEFPYDQIRRVNAGLGNHDAEYELPDTGIFDDNRYFDVFVEYARESVDDIYMKVSVHNRGPDAADFHFVPQAFFRNTWSWEGEGAEKPMMERLAGNRVAIRHSKLGELFFSMEGEAQLLICDNETNVAALNGDDQGLRPYDFAGDAAATAKKVKDVLPFTDYYAAHARSCDASGWAAIYCRFFEDGDARKAPFEAARAPPKEPMYHATGRIGAGPYKDAFHRSVIKGDQAAAGAAKGTKAGLYAKTSVAGGGVSVFRVRLSTIDVPNAFEGFDEVVSTALEEADAFYANLQGTLEDPEHRRIQRQALAGMIWTKQFYNYDIYTFFEGDPGCPTPPKAARRAIRNSDWDHMQNCDIISMPDKWEFPWYATWDLAFHCLPLALVDSHFAKGQLRLITREWYMHPNGQLPAFEWNFSDVNPPVHAWASWRVYQMDKKKCSGVGDMVFLEEIFHKLMINFTWWVNRKDAEGRNIFQGGFLGLDNIGVFDRGGKLPTGGIINQSDGTSWMAFFSLTLMRMALELAESNPVYESIAAKFFEHFLHIARAMTRLASSSAGLWDEEDNFYYDVLTLPGGNRVPLKVRSMVGLIPLFAVEVLEPSILEKLPRFAARLEYLLTKRKDLAELVSRFEVPGVGERRLLSLLRGFRMKCLLKRMLDPEEFLSEYGVRALSRYHLKNPFVLDCEGHRYEIGYEAAESSVKIMGGNSNWRGPIWFPMNYLIIESLQKFHQYYGSDYHIECPTGSGNKMPILEIADEISKRLVKLFEPSPDGKGRPALRVHEKMATDPHFRDHILFYEHFHGDTGRGVGASHQTGWTGLIAKLIQARGIAGKERSPQAFAREVSF